SGSAARRGPWPWLPTGAYGLSWVRPDRPERVNHRYTLTKAYAAPSTGAVSQMNVPERPERTIGTGTASGQRSGRGVPVPRTGRARPPGPGWLVRQPAGSRSTA